MTNAYDGVRVVLIEDNEDDAELALRGLKKNCNVTEELLWLKDGAEAFDYLMASGVYAHRNRSYKPELILLDLKLPKIGGIKLLETIKNDPLLKTISTVILTSSREISDIRECYAYGANSFITKPIDYYELIETTNKVSSYWLFTNQQMS